MTSRPAMAVLSLLLLVAVACSSGDDTAASGASQTGAVPSSADVTATLMDPRPAPTDDTPATPIRTPTPTPPPTGEANAIVVDPDGRAFTVGRQGLMPQAEGFDLGRTRLVISDSEDTTTENPVAVVVAGPDGQSTIAQVATVDDVRLSATRIAVSLLSGPDRMVPLDAGRPRSLPAGCWFADAHEDVVAMICDDGGAIRILDSDDSDRPLVGTPPAPADSDGEWIGVQSGPDGRTLAAVWSSACGVPTTYHLDVQDGLQGPIIGTDDAPVGSQFLFWRQSGSANVAVLAGGCADGPTGVVDLVPGQDQATAEVIYAGAAIDAAVWRG